ncbi:efflux RND transporter periplasmic adaptor subunit [soil metagenome]
MNRMNSKLKLKPLPLLAACTVALGIGFALISSQPKAENAKPATKRAAMTVTAVRPASGSLPIRLSANGNIAAWQGASIGSESGGLRLTEVLVNVGDQVTAGQVLASFAGAPVAADVAQARANLAEAEAYASDAAGNAARARTLQTTGALSTQQINQYLTTEQTAKAKVEAAKAMLTAQQLRQKNVNVIAPDSGVISARTATVGAVTAAGVELFRMIRKGRLEWRAEVTATELGKIRTGMPVTVIAANGTEVRGKVRMVAPTVDPQSRSALVYVDLAPAADKIAPVKAGMYARGEFDMGSSSALTVPQEAVVMRDGFSYVFLLGSDNRVSQKKITAGRRIGSQVEVLEGMPADALVVSSGAGFLNDGDVVKNVTPPSAAKIDPAKSEPAPAAPAKASREASRPS